MLKKIRRSPQPRQGGGRGGKKAMSWVVAATPTNPTTTKISRAKHDPREHHGSLLYRPTIVWRLF